MLGAILGFLAGGAAGAGSGLLTALLFDLDDTGRLVLIIACGAVGAIYSAIAFGNGIYRFRPLSILGWILDHSWSLVNTLGGLLVWIPACLITGKFVPSNPDSQRSGTFVFDRNPRDPGGSTYGATTIGTVIGGGWSSHEETHVWQARILGPAYFLLYLISLILNILFRLFTFRVSDLTMEAYYRVVFEEWAYWGGETSSSTVHAGGWIGGFFLALLYATLIVLIPIGIASGQTIIWVIGIIGTAAYSLIRALLPRGH